MYSGVGLVAFQMSKLLGFLYLRREQYQKLICGKIWGTASIYSLMMEMRTSLLCFRLRFIFMDVLLN